MQTEIETEEVQTIEKEKRIDSPGVKSHPSHDTKLKIMRIELDDNLTRIDFVYYPPGYYVNGGWVQIDPASFIRPAGTSTRLTLVKALGIPYAPSKHHFKTNKDVLYYTLYFPPLPDNVTEIDIIEKDISGGTYFNFYGVSMQRVRNEVIRVKHSS